MLSVALRERHPICEKYIRHLKSEKVLHRETYGGPGLARSNLQVVVVVAVVVVVVVVVVMVAVVVVVVMVGYIVR